MLSLFIYRIIFLETFYFYVFVLQLIFTFTGLNTWSWIIDYLEQRNLRVVNIINNILNNFKNWRVCCKIFEAYSGHLTPSSEHPPPPPLILSSSYFLLFT